MSDMQIQEALRQFQVQLSADGRSGHTRAQYERHVRGLIGWLAKRGYPPNIADISPTTVAEFVASDDARLSARGGVKKATSANAQRTSLRCFLRWAHEAGLARANAARLLKRARCAPAPPRALFADEQQRLLKVLAAATGPEAERDRMLVELLLGTGLRIGSALSLDIGDIDLAHNEVNVRVAKNNRPASTMLPAGVAKKLKVFIAGRSDGPLFMADDRRVSMRHMQRRLSGWFAAAKIVGKSAHSLRHSFACRVYGETGDLQITQAALGHASITSTVIYARVDKARLRAAVGA